MRISRIKFKNFRNFKDEGQIDFPTDGTVSIIYGPNGVGKTTLHQLFQWIFYGEVNFNKTASKKMYNLEFEQEIPYGYHFTVDGTIDFEQLNSDGNVEYYSIRRIWYYEKEIVDCKKIDTELRMLKKIGDDWRPIKEDPKDIIEYFLPSGLSQYFFFDGESMIADLNQKGKDSAKALRKALFAIFNLNIYEQASAHIGSISSSQTVLGSLNAEKVKNSSSFEIIKADRSMTQSQEKVDKLKEEADMDVNKISECEEKVKSLSELIGSATPKSSLEKQWENNNDTIKTLKGNIDHEIKMFGKEVARQYPYICLSRIIEQAQYRIKLKVEDDKLIPGLTKQLLDSLQEEEYCICGNKIEKEEISSYNEWLKKFPPLSYKHIYEQFKDEAARLSSDCDPEELLNHMDLIYNDTDQIEKLNRLNDEINDELKNGTDVDAYIIERKDMERQASYLERKLKDTNQKLGVQERLLKQYINKYKELIDNHNFNQSIDLQIQVMEEVQKYFDNLLRSSTEMYSSKLRDAIQELLDRMLTSVRKVEMTSSFELSVKDKFDDEAKSEGQFAVVSFAYIGGIFKLISEVPELMEKEFPLVLDGPFSKLDVIQRQNVIDTIPTYAPQIILFSKDDLSSCFDENMKDNVWTIYSNDERNVSFVKKGYDEEVFAINEI